MTESFGPNTEHTERERVLVVGISTDVPEIDKRCKESQERGFRYMRLLREPLKIDFSVSGQTFEDMHGSGYRVQISTRSLGKITFSVSETDISHYGIEQHWVCRNLTRFCPRSEYGAEDSPEILMPRVREKAA